jgi:hypothetical protein
MSDVPQLCEHAKTWIDPIESENATLHNPTITDAIRDLRWAIHNVRNQADGLEAELLGFQSLLNRPGR